MAEVKWIKIVVDIFDDEKILLIESLPAADSIITIWFKLLTLAGKQNNNGVFLLNDKIAYTDEMLATIFRRDISTVRLALETFQQFEMIEIIDGVITIPNWGKHQSLEQIEKKNEYQRNYMREYRERQKAKIECKTNSKTNSKANSKANVSSLEEDIDKEQEIEKELEDRKELNNKNNNIYYCPEPEKKPEVFISWTTNTDELYEVTYDYVNEMKELYPAVDVEQALRNMKGWLLADSSRRKTKSGMKRFINSWLAKEQNQGGSKRYVRYGEDNSGKRQNV